MLGFIFAVISSIFYSLYVVPRKLSNLSAVTFSFLMAISFSFGSIVLYLLQPLIKFHEIISPVVLWSVIAGAMWAAAFVCFVKAIDMIGLAKSNQWKNLQGPVAVFFSFIFLQEFIVVNPFYAVSAALVIFLSALCFTIVEGHPKHLIARGVYLACFAALGFGTVGVIQKYITDVVGVYTPQVIWSLSIVLSLGIYVLLSSKRQEVVAASRRDIGLSLIAGLFYLGASFFQLFSYQHLAASIAFTVIQLSALWTVLIGIFVFREINFRKHYRRIGFGFFLMVMGIVFLMSARL